MKTLVIIIAFIMGLYSVMGSEGFWMVEVNVEDRTSKLIYQKKSGEKISFMTYFLTTELLAEEVKQQFKKDYPVLWESAVSSSGNSHNPKVIPLKSKFSEALKKTAAFKKIEKSVNEKGFKIDKISHEKFSLNKTDHKVKVFAVVWVSLVPDIDFSDSHIEPPLSNKTDVDKRCKLKLLVAENGVFLMDGITFSEEQLSIVFRNAFKLNPEVVLEINSEPKVSFRDVRKVFKLANTEGINSGVINGLGESDKRD